MNGPLLALWRVARVLSHAVRGLWLARFRLPGLAPAERDALVQQWGHESLRRLGVELRVTGASRPGAVLIVANHVSWLDIPILQATAPHARFVSKSAIAHWPLVGTLARAGRTLFIERERKRDAMRVVHEVAGALKAGDAITVFPEGTTGEGHEVLPFHGNLLQAAITTGSWVQPVVLSYSEPGHRVSVVAPYTRGVSLLASVLRIAGTRGLVATVRFLDPVTPDEADRRKLALDLHARVAQGLAEMIPPR